MQTPTASGLRPAVEASREVRYTIECIQNAAELADQYSSALVSTWAHRTPQEAHDFLYSPDVTVTNMSDKEDQLVKIKQLDNTVRRAFKGVQEKRQPKVLPNAPSEKQVVKKEKKSRFGFGMKRAKHSGEATASQADPSQHPDDSVRQEEGLEAGLVRQGETPGEATYREGGGTYREGEVTEASEGPEERQERLLEIGRASCRERV